MHVCPALSAMNLLQLRLLSWLKLFCLKATNPSCMHNVTSSMAFTLMSSELKLSVWTHEPCFLLKGCSG